MLLAAPFSWVGLIAHTATVSQCLSGHDPSQSLTVLCKVLTTSAGAAAWTTKHPPVYFGQHGSSCGGHRDVLHGKDFEIVAGCILPVTWMLFWGAVAAAYSDQISFFDM
jgi:hypothetical protein